MCGEWRCRGGGGISGTRNVLPGEFQELNGASMFRTHVAEGKGGAAREQGEWSVVVRDLSLVG